MKLTLRLNHFFRSFWAFDRTKDLTKAYFKYIDLNVLDSTIYDDHSFFNGVDAKDFYCPFDSIDVSYWDTYIINDCEDFLLIYLLRFYTGDARKYGIKNFRTDTINYQSFGWILSHINPEHYNNKWETAHLSYVEAFNPHWNEFHHNKNERRYMCEE
jgi:hypothetical protein